jgi:hypothetical protein
MTRPALFVVKATITPELEEAFNQWYDSVRSEEAARVPGCLAMRRYAPIPLEGAHAGSEPGQYMVATSSTPRSRAFVNPIPAGHDEGLQRASGCGRAGRLAIARSTRDCPQSRCRSSARRGDRLLAQIVAQLEPAGGEDGASRTVTAPTDRATPRRRDARSAHAARPSAPSRWRWSPSASRTRRAWARRQPPLTNATTLSAVGYASRHDLRAPPRPLRSGSPPATSRTSGCSRRTRSMAAG